MRGFFFRFLVFSQPKHVSQDSRASVHALDLDWRIVMIRWQSVEVLLGGGNADGGDCAEQRSWQG